MILLIGYGGWLIGGSIISDDMSACATSIIGCDDMEQRALIIMGWGIARIGNYVIVNDVCATAAAAAM